MTVKSLKKQLMAAIAMVLVATIALGSSTYAWFAANKVVTAEASKIYAQTNAGSLVIMYNASAIYSDLTTDASEIADTPLFPAQWSNTVDPTTYQFETGFAEVVEAAGLKAGTLVAVGDPDAAVTGEYAVKSVFNVSAKGENLANLKVTQASIGGSGNANLDSALRVLVVCGSNWVLCNQSGIVSSSGSTAGFLASTVTAGNDVEVDMYVFYDGNDSEIYTNNLSNLATASKVITITLGVD
ncbi:MAG: hypothetical protein IJL09_07670 [Lachnospiraceae bacterium]|nr:hypothetical protein [Lachnospiraceae bacterium]